MEPPISLHICFRAEGFKWPLHDHYAVQVWAGHELIATLPGRLIRHLVELHLNEAQIAREVQSLIRKPLAVIRPRPPLAIEGFDRERREALKTQRRRR